MANPSKTDKPTCNDVKNPIINNDNATSNDINSNEMLQLMNFGIVIFNVTAKWTNAQTENSLENINLIIRPGRLVAIIGAVGAGKVYLIY